MLNPFRRKPKGIAHIGTINLSDPKEVQEKFKSDPAGVMAAIIQQQRTLFSKQIEHWIFARANAENPIYPIRTQLYDIFDDTMIDGFLTGIIYNHRILPVKNKLFAIKDKNDKINANKTKLLAKKQWLRDLIKYSLESIFWGYSLIYFDELKFVDSTAFVQKVSLIPRKHVMQEKHVYLIFQSDLNGVDYTTPPVSNYVIPVGDPFDLGLLNKATPLVILKKHGWNNWDQFAEKFGLPIITVKTASQDPRVQQEIEKWLEALSTGAYGIFPMDTEMHIVENKKTDAYMVFSALIDKVNEELAILINGQTMTSMNGSSKSQGEVHERVMDEITKDDENFIETIVNEILIPLLRDKHGYPFEDGDYFEFCQPEDLNALLAIFTGVDAMGFQIDPKQVEEKFGTKIIGLKAPKPAPPGNDPADQPGNDPEDPDEQEQDTPAEPDKSSKPQKGVKKAATVPEDPELKASDLIKLHAKITQLYGGTHVL